jgi:glycosyltransferase involved in cell wall biosynthesis
MLQRGSVGRGLADEIDLLAPYDDVLFAAPEEMESYIAAGLESARCRPWAWGLDSPPEAAAAETDPAPRYDLGFIGGGNLFNVDALRFLGTAILPRLSQRLGRPVTALLAGGAAGAVAKEFDGQPGITLAPWVEDLGSFYRSVGLIIIPLLGGTGVSIKSMEAAQFGKAMVSTAIGMRGLQFRPGIDVEMAETAETFAAIAMALISDPARRLRLGASARQQAEARHSLAAFTAEIGDLIGR